MDKFIGFNYGYLANRGEITSSGGLDSQNKLYSIGFNWVCLAITCYQDMFYSTDIHSDFFQTPSETDIKKFITVAHDRGVKVCLKPMVNCKDNMWRAHIGFPDANMDEHNIYWNKWIDSYKHFLLFYAELAQDCGVEMLCIGCEMLGTEHRFYDWRYLISEVRKVYGGEIVYGTNHDHEEDAEWTKDLDYLATSAYYPVGENGNSYESMINEWKKVQTRLDAIAEKRNQKFLFTEIGCRSATGCAAMPWDFSHLEYPYDEDEQYKFYKSCLDVFLPDKWFAGAFFWDWPSIQYNENKCDIGFNIHQKKTEQYFKELLK